jgi:hypothetical protein
MRPYPSNFWRLSTICLALALCALTATWIVRERAQRREYEIERGEWEITKRGWSGRLEEQQVMIERLFDSQDEWSREVRELKEENAKLRQDRTAAAKAATRPAASGVQ